MKLEDFINKKLLSSTKRSKCYILKNGDVFKQFNKPLSIAEVKKFKYFLNYENESFLFPFDFVYDSKNFYGYITKRAIGLTLSDTFITTNLEKLSTHSIKLEKNMNYISEGRIVMTDFHSKNVMYDGNLLQVIDPDEYEIRDIDSIESIKNINSKYFRILITNLFILNMRFGKNTEYILNKINKYAYCDIKVSEMILSIKDLLEKYYKEKIDTMEDFSKMMRK